MPNNCGHCPVLDTDLKAGDRILYGPNERVGRVVALPEGTGMAWVLFSSGLKRVCRVNCCYAPLETEVYRRAAAIRGHELAKMALR